MKRLSMVLSLMAVALLISAMPAFTAEEATGQKEMKKAVDECMLIAKNCIGENEVYNVRQRIDMLNAEIAKGNEVYTKDELDRMKASLRNAYKELYDYNRR